MIDSGYDILHDDKLRIDDIGGAGPVLGTLVDTFVNIPVTGTDRTMGLDLRAGYLGTPATLSFIPSHYDPECGPTDIRTAMNATAVDLGTPGRDKYFGTGLVQAQDAAAYLDQNGCSGY